MEVGESRWEVVEQGQPIYLDIMVNDLFYRQIRYDLAPRKEIVDGRVMDVDNMDDMENYVREKFPWLKRFTIYPTTNRIIQKK